jgi:hypothetical protein
VKRLKLRATLEVLTAAGDKARSASFLLQPLQSFLPPACWRLPQRWLYETPGFTDYFFSANP